MKHQNWSVWIYPNIAKSEIDLLNCKRHIYNTQLNVIKSHLSPNLELFNYFFFIYFFFSDFISIVFIISSIYEYNVTSGLYRSGF